MKMSILIATIAGLLLLSACSAPSNTGAVQEGGDSAKQQEIEELNDEIDRLESELEQARGESSVAQQDQDTGAADTPSAQFDPSVIEEALRARPELVPIEADLGGTIYWYTIEAVPNNDGGVTGLVYAYAEDGHNGANMVYEYLVAEDGSIHFTLVSWDYV